MASAQQPTGAVDDRDRRAATECMIVIDEAPGLFRVWSEDRDYWVDAREGTCECPDHEYRDVRCKHMRRVEFATGRRDIPRSIPRGEWDGVLARRLQEADR